jgi:hypothetical protein
MLVKGGKCERKTAERRKMRVKWGVVKTDK